MIHSVQEDEAAHREHDQEGDERIPPYSATRFKQNSPAEGANVLHTAEGNWGAVVEVEPRHNVTSAARAFNFVFDCHNYPLVDGRACSDAATRFCYLFAPESLTTCC